MTASCISDIIRVRGIDREINKREAAIIVVSFDLIISFFLWCALVAGKPL